MKKHIKTVNKAMINKTLRTGGCGEHVGSLRHKEVQAVVLDRHLVERIDLLADRRSSSRIGERA